MSGFLLMTANKPVLSAVTLKAAFHVRAVQELFCTGGSY